ncbi:MAG: hypothetical protein KDB00_28945 [Planctomycetales bacterium]|nr:hypothetical protein [Planctomycetales bacterium]
MGIGFKALLFAGILFNAFSRRIDAQTAGSSLDVPQTRLAPLGAPVAAAPSEYGSPNYGVPNYGAAGQTYSPPPGLTTSPTSGFDPYASGPAAGYVQPSGPPALLGSGLFNDASSTAPQGGLFAPASPPMTSFGTPIYGGLANQPPPLVNPGTLFGGSTAGGFSSVAPSGAYAYPPTGYAAPPSYGFPSSAYPSGSPSTLFPGGLFAGTPSFAPQFNPYRLIQRARFRHTFLYDGDGAKDLSINDTDVAFAFAVPQFLFSTQPLYIAPSFSLHLWDGPEETTNADLPGSAFSAFLDFAWQSDPNRIIGADLGVSVGAFSEFGVFNNDGLRIRGKGLGTFRITPASTFKLGIYYYDRVDIKLLPAVGLFWRPDPFTKVDLFFPQPKYSHYLSTVGTNDVWWYASGEYGGGSWTIERDNGDEDQVDINDIRLTLGFEWGESERMRAGLRTWFFEFGYVGGRELIYRHNPQDNLTDIGDTWMVRLGMGY